MRSGILAFFLFAGFSYEKICSSLKVLLSTASTICEKVKARLAENAENIPPSSDIDGIPYEQVKALFTVVESYRVRKCGIKEKIPEGSAAEILRDGILCDLEDQDIPWWSIAQELGVDSTACRATIEEVVHQYLNITDIYLD